MSRFTLNENEAPKPIMPQARKGEGRMDEDERQSVLSGLISDAERLIDEEISPERARATDYYHAEPFGNEEEGRSQVVISEVRDVVNGLMPSLMRLFFGADRAVEYAPRTIKMVQLAPQATDYAQYVFVEDNAGFMRTREVLMDGLVRKLGVFKWCWDESAQVRAFSEKAMPEDQLTELASRDEVKLLRVTKHDDGTSDVDYTVTGAGCVRIYAVPPEELIYDREARSIEDATFVGHRRNLKRGDLVALGIPEKVIDEHGGRDMKLKYNADAVERRATETPNMGDNPSAGTGNDDIKLVECYVRIDFDGDGVNELSMIRTIGAGNYPVGDPQPVDEIPFALFTPFPEPHSMTGQSVADLTMDLQLIKSMLTRGMLDSFALSIFPRTAFLEGFASVEDILNTEIGAPMRMSKENAIVPFSHPFTGEKAMGILQYFDDVSENRVGAKKGAIGLDSDALQSSTQQAVTAAVDKAQEQVELLARIFAEQALKPLFRGIYRMLVKYRPAERLVRLRGEYVPIDTTAWDADCDVVVNVALGSGDTQRRIDALMGIKATQEQVLASLGPANPICTMAQYSNTLRKLTELSGFKDPSQFFNAVDPNWQPPPAQPQMSPEQTIAQAQLQIEQMRTQKDLEIKQAELQLKQQKQMHDMELEERKLANDFVLRRYQIDAQFKATYSQAQLEADARSEESALEGAMSVRQQMHTEATAQREHELASQAQQHEQGLAEDQQAHDQQMAEQQAAAPQGATE